MTGERAIALVCAFAAGVLVTLQTEDWRHAQREAAPLPAVGDYGPQGAAIDPAPASLQFPLCEHGWIAFCSDGQECRFRCAPDLSAQVPAPKSAGSQGVQNPR